MGRHRTRDKDLALPVGLQKIGNGYHSDFVCGGVRYCRAWGSNYQVATTSHRSLQELAERKKRGYRNNELALTALRDRFNENLKATCRPGTIATYKYRLDRVFQFLGNKMKVSELTAQHVKDYIKWRRSGTKKASDTTVNAEIDSLQAVLNWAKADLIDSNPIESVKGISHPVKKTKRLLTNDEIELLLNHSHNGKPCYYATALLALAHTGMRKGEMSHLRWQDMDMKSKVVKIAPRKDWQPKTRKSARTVKMTQRLHEALVMMWAKSESKEPDAMPFPKNNLLRGIKNCARVCGIERPNELTAKSFRISFITYALDASKDVIGVRDLVGHERASTTLDVYAQVSEESKRKAIDAFESYTKKVANG